MAKHEKFDMELAHIPGMYLATSNHKVDVYYPDDGERTESSLFRRTKRKLVKVQKLPCWICGTHEQLEVHHFHIQWALANCVDWDLMRELHPDFDWSTFTKPEDFVDSEYNMMVLCRFHH